MNKEISKDEITKELSDILEELHTDEEQFVTMCVKRNMLFMKQGMEIIVNNRHGYITGSTGLNLLVKFDNEDFSTNVQPQWKTKYFSEEGDLIKEY